MLFAYTLVCFIYGTTFLAIRIGDNAGMPPFLFAAIRFTAAGLLILAFFLWKQRTAFPRKVSLYGQLIRIGFFNTTVVFALVYAVEQHVPSSYAALLSATMPFMVMLLERISFKQRITLIQSFGLSLGFLGVLAIAWPGIRAGVPHWVTGTILLILAQIGAALGATWSRKVIALGTSPFIANGFQVLFGGLGLFVLAGITGGLSFASVHSWGNGIVALIYLTVFGSIVASSLFYWMIKRTNALIPSTWTYVSPVIAMAVGYLWYKEPISVWTITGIVLILCGVLLVNLRAFQAVLKTPTLLKKSA